MSSLRECKKCGNDFEPQKKNQVFCGEDCRKDYYRNLLRKKMGVKKVKFICESCGEERTSYRKKQKYCDETCRRAALWEKTKDDQKKRKIRKVRKKKNKNRNA